MARAWWRRRSVRPISRPQPETRHRPSTPFSPALTPCFLFLCLLLAASPARAERTAVPPPATDLASALRAAAVIADDSLPSTGAAPTPADLKIPRPDRTTAKVGEPDGGDDILAVTAFDLQQPSLASAANGDLYLAVPERESGGNDWDIHVYRSQDGGKSWLPWGFLGDSLALTTHTQPVILVPPGPNEACYVAYTYWSSPLGKQVRLARSSTTGPSASFTEVTAFSAPSIDFDHVDLVSDAVDNESYWIYLVAEGDDGNGKDVWFTRSTNQGASCEPAYAIASLSLGDRSYEHPRVDYGTGQRIHVSWEFDLDGADRAVRYRNADGYANGGLSAWNGFVYLTSPSNGMHERDPVVRASDVDDTVVLHYRRQNLDNVVQWSTLETSSDRGTTWGVEPTQSFEPAFTAEVLELPEGQGWAWMADDEFEAQVKWCPHGGNFWTLPHDLMDRDYYDGRSWPRLCAAPSLAHPGEVAMVWTRVDVDPKEVWFDATWRDDPGYPNLERGFPVAIGSEPLSDPALVDVDDDLDLEIVYGDSEGYVQILHHDASPLSGWPVRVGPMDRNAPVAVGDLHGEGAVEIVAGTSDGWVHALSPAGEVLPGWPVDLGTGMDAYVSIGAVRPPYVRYVVACSSNQAWLLNYRGEIQSGFPWTFAGQFRAPAAIGDVDGDGYGEIVTLKDDWIHVNDPRSASPQAYRKLTGERFYGPPSLGDVVPGGDLEIAASTFSGKVFLMDAGLADRPGWPYVDPDGFSTSPVTLANMVADVELELVFAHQNFEVHNFFHDGSEVSGWPRHTGSGWWILGSPIVECTDALAPDILIGARDGLGYDWDGLGMFNPEWPKDIGGQCEMTPAAGDVDQDGRLEVVFLNLGTLAIVDVGEYDPPWDGERGRWPMAMHDPQRTSCIDCGENLAVAAPEETRIAFRPPAPNPARGVTTLRYSLRERSKVELNLYDVRGRLTRRLVNEVQDTGWRQVAWDGRDQAGHRVANGAYFARLSVSGSLGEEVLARRVVLLR